MSEDFHAPVHAPSERQPTEDEALKVVLVDQSRDAQDEARDRADARLDQELGEGGKFKQFLNGIWKGNIAKDFYRQRYIHQDLDTIKSAESVHINEDADRRSQALAATIDRFSSEHDELIHTNAGERREVQAEDSALSIGIKGIIRDAVERAQTSGRPLSDRILQEEKTRFLTEYRKEHGEEALGKGLATADNLLDIAQAVYGAVEHGQSLDNVVTNLQVITGEARNGARTEARYNAVDKVVDKLAKSKVGSLVNESTIGAATAIAGTVLRLGGQSAVGNIARVLVPGAAAGLWAGLRENRRVKDERAQHAREMAVGGVFNEDDKRRVEMEDTRYNSISAHNLIQYLSDVSSEETFNEHGNDALQAALDALAGIQARVDLSDDKKIDLISYTSKTDVGEERMMLDLARREARLSLEARLTDEARVALNLGPNASLKGLINQRALGVARVLTEGETGIDAKDSAFNKLKARRVAKAAAVGAATGITFGLVSQEVFAAVNPSLHGLFDAARGELPEAGADGLVHQTSLESMFRGDETIVHTDASSTFDSYDTAPNGSIELSDDHTLVTNPDGTIDLKDPSGDATVEGLVVDANGTFDQASLDKLDAAGMVVEDRSFNEDVTTTTSEVVSTEQYIANHAAESTSVQRDLWYGNDTPGVYDENELRVYRGGSAEAPGLIDGGYQYTVAGMEASGSWQGGESVDWNQAAAGGNLFVAVSGTFDSQGNPFMIPIGPDGAVNIPADSPAGQFFANENNSVAFNGAYMEIVQTTGVDQDGTVHIRPLATLVGDASVGEITDTVTTTVTEHHADYAITTGGFDTVQENFTEMPPVVPIDSRRSMEAIRSRPEAELVTDEVTPGYGYGERFPVSRDEFSPRLRDSPEAQLDLRQELGWYRDELARREGAAYAQEVQDIITNTPELTEQTSELRSVVTIPVAAAYESENIYGTLSLYAQQDEDKLAQNLIILNTNWLDTAQQDPDSRQKIEKTLAEIERAKQDFPSLRIASFTRQYESEVVKKTGGPIGYVASDLLNVALLTLDRYAEQNPSADVKDVAIIRQDADMEGMSRHYLRNLEKSFDSSEADIFNGVIRSGVRMQSRYPGVGILTNFSQALNVAKTQQNKPWTVGINTVVRASTLAAIGGLGKRGQWSGPGSDDVQVGQRVEAARRNAEMPDGGYSDASTGGAPVKRKIVTQVAGLTVDSSALRLIPQYLLDRHFGAAWDGNASGDSGFAAGPGGYKNREEFANEVMAQNPRDIVDDDHMFKFINTNLSAELHNNGVDDNASKEEKEAAAAVIRKTLAVFFGSVPGAYVINGELGTRNVSFELTKEGKDFIENRVKRESNGKFGPYGFRKMRQLYGVSKGVRKPVAAESALVSPLQ